MSQLKSIAAALALSTAALLASAGCVAQADGDSGNASDLASPQGEKTADAQQACGWGSFGPFLTIGPLSYGPCGAFGPFFTGPCGGFGGCW